MTEPTPLDYQIPTYVRRHSFFVMLPISIVMSFVFAVEFVIVMTLTLPKTDGAYGEAPFADPFVLPLMSMGATLLGLLAAPCFYFACRSSPLGKSVAIVAGVTMAEILIVTPFQPGVGFFGSLVAFGCGLALARRWREVKR